MLGVRLGLCSLYGLLYVLGAGQHGFGWQDKSRDCYPAYTADWTKA